MKSIFSAILAGLFAIALLSGCNKSDDAVDNMKTEMGEALDATKEAAEAVAAETKDVVTNAAQDAAAATKAAASEAKEEAGDAVQAAKNAAAHDAK